MPTHVIIAETTDGYIYGSNAAYATARATSSGLNAGLVAHPIGQSFEGGVYYVFRNYFEFDASALGSGEIITAGTLTLTASADYSTTDFQRGHCIV